MTELFEIAAGSVAGRDHVLAGRNNQDAYVWSMSDQAVIGVVCDGCSKERHSEVGSQLTAQLLVETIRRHHLQGLARGNPNLPFIHRGAYFPFWEKVRLDVLAQIRVLANAMGESFSRTVWNYFLFTTVGFIVTELGAAFFSIGDGVFFINDEMVRLGPFTDNKPPYLAYDLVDLPDDSFESSDLRFRLDIYPPGAVDSLLIGTDGILDLIKSQDRVIPGKTELVGPISQYWESDRFFRNPDSVRRRLVIINRESVRVDPQKRSLVKEVGRLADDTTLIVLRRQVEAEGVVEP